MAIPEASPEEREHSPEPAKVPTTWPPGFPVSVVSHIRDSRFRRKNHHSHVTVHIPTIFWAAQGTVNLRRARIDALDSLLPCSELPLLLVFGETVPVLTMLPVPIAPEAHATDVILIQVLLLTVETESETIKHAKSSCDLATHDFVMVSLVES